MSSNSLLLVSLVSCLLCSPWSGLIALAIAAAATLVFAALGFDVSRGGEEYEPTPSSEAGFSRERGGPERRAGVCFWGPNRGEAAPFARPASGQRRRCERRIDDPNLGPSEESRKAERLSGREGTKS